MGEQKEQEGHGTAPVGIADTDVTGPLWKGPTASTVTVTTDHKSSPLHSKKLKSCNKRPQATAVTCHSVLSHPPQPCLTSWCFLATGALSALMLQHQRPNPPVPHEAQGQNLKVKCRYTVLLSFPPVHTLLRGIFSP